MCVCVRVRVCALCSEQRTSIVRGRTRNCKRPADLRCFLPQPRQLPLPSGCTVRSRSRIFQQEYVFEAVSDGIGAPRQNQRSFLDRLDENLVVLIERSEWRQRQLQSPPVVFHAASTTIDVSFICRSRSPLPPALQVVAVNHFLQNAKRSVALQRTLPLKNVAETA